METGNINIYGKLVAQTGEGKVTDTDQIFDKTLGKFQSEINGERDNYYTKEEIDNLVEAIKQFNIQIVNTLPEASESTMFTIYLIPSSNPKTTNSKDEFITVKSGNTYSWEQVGSTEIDLSGYSTTQEMNAAILSGLNNLSFLTGEKVVNLGVDEEPTAGSTNLVESGGVKAELDMLDERTSEISKEITEDENSDSIQFIYNNEVIHEITNEYADFTNLKNNGQDVLTEHQDISYLATKEEVEAKQDKIDGLSEASIEGGEESLEFKSNDKAKFYAKVDKNGIHAKSMHLIGENGTNIADIDCGNAEDEEDEVVFEDENAEQVAKVTPQGIRSKSFMDMGGNILSVNNDICYISPNGNDDNSGDSEHPMATVNGAILKGFSNILLLGGVYEQTINISTNKAVVITIKGERGSRVVFKKPDSLISDAGQESLVPNYTNVYKLENVDAINYGSETNRAEWLFFDGLNDENTAITAQEAHPLQRGQFHRCDCTKIVKTTATTLNDALTEIENADTYKWFYDDGTLYFNRAASTATYPLYKSVGNYFTTRNNQSLVLSNIEFRYGVVNLDYLNVVKVYNCAAKYIYGFGAFRYNRAVSVVFNKCEASSCFCGLNGDGFNADGSVTGGDYFAKSTQALFIDCWSHDNNDDGFSDHEYCESTIIGGLYEWNKKGGVTPSFGSQCSCHHVYSRRNYSGFAYGGAVNDHGNKGQVVCFGCISEANNRGGMNCGFTSYTNNSDNRMLLYNCLAIGETVGYKCAVGNYMDLYDCKTLNCTTPKEAQGTVNVYNSISLTNLN